MLFLYNNVPHLYLSCLRHIQYHKTSWCAFALIRYFHRSEKQFTLAKLNQAWLKVCSRKRLKKKNRYNCIVWRPLAHQFLNRNVILPYLTACTKLSFRMFLYIFDPSPKNRHKYCYASLQVPLSSKDYFRSAGIERTWTPFFVSLLPLLFLKGFLGI